MDFVIGASGQSEFSWDLKGDERAIATTAQVDGLLDSGALVAVGVSGGKDSQATALRVRRYLDEITHAGARVLVHADLGRVEWRDSLPSCQRLASYLGWELIVVQRAKGDMLDRWITRWKSNLERYKALLCVKVILPWSTPSMRFCTSELKVATISSALRKRWPSEAILNVTGIRRQESESRRRMPVASVHRLMERRNAMALSWNPIIEWSKEVVFKEIASSGLRLHDAYVKWGASRVSCAYCIMSSRNDLAAAAACEENHEVYRQMVQLEAASTFAFQGERWLADTAPGLLSDQLRAEVKVAKEKALKRSQIEAEIPAQLLFRAGWPDRVPTLEEARTIASVRRRIGDLLGIECQYLDAESVIERYIELRKEARQRSHRISKKHEPIMRAVS